MRKICYSLITFSFLSSSFAASSHQYVECESIETTELNRFNLAGFIDISDKGMARAKLKTSSQMAGKDAPITEYNDIAFTGTARTYPAKSLGYNEVTLLRLKSETNGRVFSLIIAHGLLGPQSTLVVNTIPFRAECKLGSFLK